MAFLLGLEVGVDDDDREYRVGKVLWVGESHIEVGVVSLREE